MRFLLACLLFLQFFSGVSAKEKIYVGCTPAGQEVRTFLGIPASDSVEFIRWRIILKDTLYQLNCNYGIGKPNTNGFINGGKKNEFPGRLKKEKNYLILQNGNRNLWLAVVNEDLIHFINNNYRLLVGNGGFSYTLSSTTPVHGAATNLSSSPNTLKDSMVFVGRTPCGVPGVIEPGKLCYKLKWLFVLYPNSKKDGPGKYKLLGTPFRNDGGRIGNWSIREGRNGRISYVFNDDQGKPFLFLQKIDENILMFTDSDGRMLVGDLDFSYTMNRSK